MKSEKQDVVPSAYEAPRIVDYGDLVDVTAGGQRGDIIDTFKGKHGRKHPKFS